jgi:hypothetical protein
MLELEGNWILSDGLFYGAYAEALGMGFWRLYRPTMRGFQFQFRGAAPYNLTILTPRKGWEAGFRSFGRILIAVLERPVEVGSTVGYERIAPTLCLEKDSSPHGSSPLNLFTMHVRVR